MKKDNNPLIAFIILTIITVITSCNDILIEIPHTHEWSEWEAASVPTCISDGEEKRSCTVGNCKEIETRPIAKILMSMSGVNGR